LLIVAVNKLEVTCLISKFRHHIKVSHISVCKGSIYRHNTDKYKKVIKYRQSTLFLPNVI